jgi:protein TonB
MSAAAHVVLIALAIDATKRTGEAGGVEPRAMETIYRVPFAEPTPPPAPPRTPTAPAPPEPGPALPAGPIIEVPIEVPGGLPPIVDALPTSGDPVFRGAPVSGAPIPSGPLSGGAPPPLHTDGTVDRQAIPLGGGTPRYPEMLRQAGVSGEVLAQFVVDTLGRVEPSSVRILASTHGLFERSVRAALASARFVPAEVRGQKVRQLVQRPFRFEVVTERR